MDAANMRKNLSKFSPGNGVKNRLTLSDISMTIGRKKITLVSTFLHRAKKFLIDLVNFFLSPIFFRRPPKHCCHAAENARCPRPQKNEKLMEP